MQAPQLPGALQKARSYEHLLQRKNAMQEHPNKRLDPTVQREETLELIRRAVFTVAPYTGLLGVMLIGKGIEEPVRLTGERREVPQEANPRFASLDDVDADKVLLGLLVSVYREYLDYQGKIVVSLFEAKERMPMVADFDGHEIFLEFGSARAGGYLEA